MRVPSNKVFTVLLFTSVLSVPYKMRAASASSSSASRASSSYSVATSSSSASSSSSTESSKLEKAEMWRENGYITRASSLWVEAAQEGHPEALEAMRKCEDQLLDLNYYDLKRHSASVQKKAFSLAEEIARKRLGLGDATARFNIGNALALQGRHKGALKCFSELLEDEPENPNILYNCGTCLLKVGKGVASCLYFEKASSLGHAPSKRALGISCLKRGLEEKGISLLEEASSELPEVFLIIADHFFDKNRDEAVKFYHKGAEKGNARAQYNLVMHYFEKKEYVNALIYGDVLLSKGKPSELDDDALARVVLIGFSCIREIRASETATLEDIESLKRYLEHASRHGQATVTDLLVEAKQRGIYEEKEDAEVPVEQRAAIQKLDKELSGCREVILMNEVTTAECMGRDLPVPFSVDCGKA